MNSNPNSRPFYDDLYSGNHIINPAYEIYDQLRINTIQGFKDNISGKILIIGCGSRKDFQLLHPGDFSVAFDLSIQAIKKAKGIQASLFVADALSIPLPQNYFDVIICSEVLEHIPNIRTVVIEMKRVLKPDGILIVSSPNWYSWFGVARWFAEKITRKLQTSDNQPYDDWKTIWKYQNELRPEFQMIDYRGVWYLPPLHFRGKGLPRGWVQLLYHLFSPLDRFLSFAFPFLGHLIVLKCVGTKENS